jgi:putative Holliday junction resolvase
MRYLGIDHGLKRLGLAISDASGLFARELTIITRKSKREDFDALSAVIAREGVACVVVGVPYSLDAPEGVHTQADTVRLWIARLREAIALPVIEWDEQLTSDDARELAKAQKRKPTAPIDDLAARLILQSYLDALHDGLA